MPIAMFSGANMVYMLELLTFPDLVPPSGTEQDVFWSGCLILVLVHFFCLFALFCFIETCRGKYDIKQKNVFCV